MTSEQYNMLKKQEVDRSKAELRKIKGRLKRVRSPDRLALLFNKKFYLESYLEMLK